MNEPTVDPVLRALSARLQLENAEASVAISHGPDHDCGTCQRVRARNARRASDREAR